MVPCLGILPAARAEAGTARMPSSASAKNRREPGRCAATLFLLLEQGAEVLLDGLELELLLIDEFGNRRGPLILEAPRDVDQAYVGLHDEIVEAVGRFGKHGEGEPPAEAL